MTGRVVLVTGGMGGIGTAICRRLAAAQGNVVAANCLPGYDRKDEWLAGLRAEGFHNIHAAEGDVADYDSATAMVSHVEASIGPVDILINNAGIVRDNVLRKMSVGEWLSVIDTNLNATFNVTRNVVEGMSERGWGRIVNLSSVNGQRGQFGQTNYSAAKAGMHGFAMALAQEVVKKGVTVNSVSPGYVATEMLRSMRPDVLEKIIAGIPMGRLATPEEIASLVAYLVSEEAGYITGANIAINGGMYMS
ncbi:MAG: acetoacetyl-CoA reductase [Betaproteobacteria bacterium]|nr:acetoacetyl-CoA reductase [Betaproteobacteria bacterium]